MYLAPAVAIVLLALFVIIGIAALPWLLSDDNHD